ncbi:MAG: hypothetical protein FD181_2867 [Prolixibacteraceae bacterium]|nr:MAG: hypothetical protein FD181_2867 [Prolixibacteraceae bacterium]
MKKTSFLSVIFLLCFGNSFSQSIEEITPVTNDFLKSLNGKQLQQVSYGFNDSARTKWTNLPVGMVPRPGIKYGDLSAESKIRFHHILTTVFSSQGYLKTTSIMQLDDILNEVIADKNKTGNLPDKNYERLKDLQWGFENYYISLWGKPGENDPWGLNFGGHHISINLTVSGDEFSITPFFIGSDPAEVQNTKYAGIRVLSKEEDYGFNLINSMNKEQQSIATISMDVPGDIITNPKSDQRLTEYWGIKANNLDGKQKEILVLLIKEYIKNLETEKSAKYLLKIEKSGIDNIYFAWIGEYEPQKPHYYIINGPDYLIEYDNKSGNHIHAIWREKGNDFGEDILKEHYLEHKH